MSLKISKEEKPLGTVGPLTLLKKMANELFLLMKGDILTLLKLNKMYKFANQRDSFLAIGIINNAICFREGLL
ncbi:MAG: hypothetical protein ACTSR3_13595 [Candidatus Helarchaeota archaeon]